MRFQKSLLVGVVLGVLANSWALPNTTELTGSVELVHAIEGAHLSDGPDTDPFQLRLASQEKVDAHKEKIVRTMRWHRLVRFGLYFSAGTALLGYMAYSLKHYWTPSIGAAIIVSDEKAGARDLRPIIKHDMRIILASNARLQRDIAKLQPRMFSTKWWKGKATYLCECFIFNPLIGGGVLVAGNKLFGRFFHEDNIAWFVNKKTKIDRLSAELRAYAQKFGLRGRQEVRVVLDPITGRSRQEVRETAPVQCPALSVEELHYYRVTLAGICRDLVAQVESIAGFMEYRLDQFQKRGVAPSPDEILQPTRLIASVNAFVRSMQNLLSPTKDLPDSTEQIKKPFGASLRFAVDVQELVNRFSGIENSVEWRMINGG